MRHDTRTPPADPRTRRLTVALLRFFIVAHSMAAVSQEGGALSGYSRRERRHAARGLLAAGFLRQVRGKTRGTVYVLTQDGLAALRALEALDD